MPSQKLKMMAKMCANTFILLSLFSISYGLRLEENSRPKLVSIMPKHSKHVDILHEAAMNSGLDFLRHSTDENTAAVVHVPTDHLEKMNQFLTENDLHDVADIKDVEEMANVERLHSVQESFTDLNDFDVNKYHNLADINKYLGYLAKTYPKIAKNFTINHLTYQRRKIAGIQINSAKNKPVMVFECGIHAREWIAPASCLYIAHQLVTGYSKDHAMKSLVDNYEWHIMPSVNPDGYYYTWTSYRMWRKNRRPHSSCPGVDLNRNWEAQWASHVGASYNPCSDVYAGPSAFSEPETQAVRDYVRPLQNRVLNYYSVHAYSQLWMFPYSYSSKITIDYAAQKVAAGLATSAIRKLTGAHYKNGSTARTIYASAGTSPDYFYDYQGIKFGFVVELRDTGTYGFRLPASLIHPTASEFFAGVKVVLGYTKSRT